MIQFDMHAAYVSIGLKPPISLGWDDFDGSEIPNDHLGSKKP